MKTAPKHILISRTDGIGDVVLTLPMARAIKTLFPQAKISFLGRNYTRAVVACCTSVDSFLSWDELGNDPQKCEAAFSAIDCIVHVFPRKEVVDAAHQFNIPIRVGTARRFHTIFKLNKRLYFSRKKSDLHEAQLNLKMLKALGSTRTFSLEEIAGLYDWNCPFSLSQPLAQRTQTDKYKLVLHPKSKGSAVEWGVANFQRLIQILPAQKVEIYITGTEAEGKMIGDGIDFGAANVHDLCGKLNLEELVGFIGQCDGLVAASTGPLHIAAAAGRTAIGIFSPKRPIHPGRWMPLGKHASYISAEEHPEDGKFLDVAPEKVAERLGF